MIHQKAFDKLDVDEVLKHYGYKPEEIHCNGIGIGVWRKEEAFQKLGEIGAVVRFMATVWAHRITPTMQPETWGRRRLPRPFRQSGVLPTED